MVVKNAPKHRLESERQVLESARDHPSIRQMVDEIQAPPALVLKYLDDNLLDVSR